MTLQVVGGSNQGPSDYKIAALTIRPLHFYTHDVYKVAIYPYMKMVFCCYLLNRNSYQAETKTRMSLMSRCKQLSSF